MLRTRTTILVAGLVLVLACVVVGGDEKAAPVADTELSIYPGSVFDIPTPPAFTENDATPGKNELIEPMFPGAPPVVPHGIQEFLPIDREDNGCIECHLIEKSEDEDAPLLPESHRIDLRGAPDTITDATAGARWVCTACHVPLTTAKPLPECVPAGR